MSNKHFCLTYSQVTLKVLVLARLSKLSSDEPVQY